MQDELVFCQFPIMINEVGGGRTYMPDKWKTFHIYSR